MQKAYDEMSDIQNKSIVKQIQKNEYTNSIGGYAKLYRDKETLSIVIGLKV